MRKHVRLFSALVSIVIVALIPAMTYAATPGTNISTSPVSKDLQVNPGGTVTTTLDVENNGTTPLPVQLQLNTFKPFGDNGQAQVVAGNAHDAFLSWVHFSLTSFIAQPGVWTPVKMTITTPPTAALDYYYAVVFKPELPSSIPGHNPEALKGENAILVLLDAMSPNAKPQLQVTGFSASHRIYEYLPATFNITVKNSGNVFLPPSGDIFVSRNSNFTGNSIATLPIDPTEGEAIPGSSRIFSSQWADGFPVFVPKTIDGQPLTDKSGNPIETLQWDFSHTNKFRFGEYYAKMVLIYNNGQRDVPISAVVSFWVIPWKLIGGTVLVITLSCVGLYVSGRKVADRTVRLSKKVRRK
jgi:hypothetical protein